MKFEIIGTPVAKGRPRLGKFGTYTPQKTACYENLINYIFTQEYPNFIPLENELTLNITAVFEIPKSYSNKKKNELLGKGKVTKPDLDNIVKSVTDALNRFSI